QDALGGQPMALPEGYHELLGLLADPESAGVSAEPDDLAEPPLRIGDILVAEDKAKREEIDAAAAMQGEQPIGVALLKSNAASLTDVAKALRKQQQMSGHQGGAEASVRVRTDRLDRLINMVGELVIAQSMLAQDQAMLHGGHYELARKVSHAGKIVREL